MKKLLSKVFCLLILLQVMSFAYSEKSTVVFDVNFLGNHIYFGLYENDDIYTAAFYDEEKAEINYLQCSSEEYGELKELSHECKVLINPISYKYEYDNKKIYNQIIEKFQTLGNLISEDYDDIDGLSFVKICVYSTTKMIELAKRAEEAIKAACGEDWNNSNDIDWDSLEDIDWNNFDDTYSNQVVYWTENGIKIHIYEDCVAIDHSETLYTGTIQEAKENGIKEVCKFCEKRLNN